jgi:thiamine kinase
MPEGPLKDWQVWELPFKQAPRLLRQLTVGRTNQSYLIEAEQQLWVLRINAENSKVLGIDRHREKIILEHAGAAGLAPEVLYCSVEHGVLISEYIDGRHWHSSELEEPEKLTLLMDSLHRIHALDVATAPFEYKQHAENYWQQLVDRNISIPDDLHRQRDKIMPLLASIPTSNVICHHDPNPKNIIVRKNRLYFLDWEYAAPAWPAFDFAALSLEWNIPLDKLPSPDDIQGAEIIQAADLYVYLCDLWSYLKENKNN